MGPTTPREPEWEHPGLQGKFSCMIGLLQFPVCPAPKGFGCVQATLRDCRVPSSCTTVK